LGYPGCYTTVRAYLQPLRSLAAVPPVQLGPPKVREVTAWMLRHPDNPTPDQQVRLKQVLANCADLAAPARQRVRRHDHQPQGRPPRQLDQPGPRR
jgi:hypothetical protein